MPAGHHAPSDANREAARPDFDATATLSAQDLLAGSNLIHEVAVPEAILRPQLSRTPGRVTSGVVRLRPLSVGLLALISRAARDDASLVPLLMIKEALVEPALAVDQIRQMHIGLVQFLVSQINLISGLGPDGESYEDALNSGVGQTHVLLARHFGWTPDQVAQLTPAQVMVYLAGIERLLAFEEERAHSRE
ncbi:MAG TPA: hypothetical protein VJZ26_14565 [Blastocatellia bacterium]|nr:hypothetical protein [Blastocatellia bacterium]